MLYALVGSQYRMRETGTWPIILGCVLKIVALRATCFIGSGNDLVVAWLSPFDTFAEVHLELFRWFTL